MKTKFNYFLILSFALAFLAPKADGQKLIQFWDFNWTRPLGGGGKADSLGTIFSYLNSLGTDTTAPNATWPLNADYAAPSLTKGKIIYTRPTAIQVGATKRDSCIDNGNGGATFFAFDQQHYGYFSYGDTNLGNNFIRTRNPSSGCAMYIYAPTTGYRNISFEFAFTASSASGATYNLVSYSTTGPLGPWKSLTQKMDTFSLGTGKRTPDTLLMVNSKTATSGWDSAYINFTSDSLNVNNNANFIIRLMPAGASSLGTSGNDRYDNFAIWGTKMVGVGINELTAGDAGYDIYPNPANNIVTLSSDNYTGMKIITIYNVLGETMSVSQGQTKQTQITTSSLSSGVYFVKVYETTTGNSYTLKLLKN